MDGQMEKETVVSQFLVSQWSKNQKQPKTAKKKVQNHCFLSFFRQKMKIPLLTHFVASTSTIFSSKALQPYFGDFGFFMRTKSDVA